MQETILKNGRQYRSHPVYDYIAMGLVYPLSEHVDIFPVRLVSTFPLSILRLPYSSHLSYIVVFIIAGGMKHEGWILSYLV
jgi:hypothetical protein